LAVAERTHHQEQTATKNQNPTYSFLHWNAKKCRVATGFRCSSHGVTVKVSVPAELGFSTEVAVIITELGLGGWLGAV
jgi:hypothetical protein